MADGLSRGSRFTDDEAREILRRAVTIESSGLPPGSAGLSLAELQAAGGEAGIDPAAIEQAAHALVRERKPPTGRLLGAPRVIDVERIVEGVPATGDFPDLLDTIRKGLGRKGQATEVHGMVEWSASSESSESYVTLASTDDRTTIRGSTNLSSLAAILFTAPTLVGGIASLIALSQAAEASNEFGIFLCVMAVPVLLVVLRAIYGRMATAEAKKLQSVVDDLAMAISESRPDGDPSTE